MVRKRRRSAQTRWRLALTAWRPKRAMTLDLVSQAWLAQPATEFRDDLGLELGEPEFPLVGAQHAPSCRATDGSQRTPYAPSRGCESPSTHQTSTTALKPSLALAARSGPIDDLSASRSNLPSGPSRRPRVTAGPRNRRSRGGPTLPVPPRFGRGPASGRPAGAPRLPHPARRARRARARGPAHRPALPREQPNELKA